MVTSAMGRELTPLEVAEMHLALAVAQSGWAHPEQEEIIEDYRREVRREFAAELAAMVRGEFVDPNPLGSIFLGGWVGDRIAGRIEKCAEEMK